jgi:regulator of replication initiation timing
MVWFVHRFSRINANFSPKITFNPRKSAKISGQPSLIAIYQNGFHILCRTRLSI